MQEIAFPGFKFQTFSGGVCPQTPPPNLVPRLRKSLGTRLRPSKDSCVVCRPHGYPPLIYYLTDRSLFKKCCPPHGKILKKGPDKISNKVVYVYCVSKAVGQSNTVPTLPPPPNKIRPVRPCDSLSPTICSNRRSRTSEGNLTVKETCPKHQLEIQHKKDKLGGNIKSKFHHNNL